MTTTAERFIVVYTHTYPDRHVETYRTTFRSRGKAEARVTAVNADFLAGRTGPAGQRITASLDPEDQS
jgi:hypothetical protein